MPQLYPFRTAFMQDEFVRIVETCQQCAYDDTRFNDVILPALITGLAACDGAQDDGMQLRDIDEVAYTLHIDGDDLPTIEAFGLGAAIAITQSIERAAEWMLIDEEDFERVRIHRQTHEDALITDADVRAMPSLDAALALIDSYIVTPFDTIGPTAPHPAAQHSTTQPADPEEL